MSTTRNPHIFISYRRDDSEFAASEIYSQLLQRFGQDNVCFDHNIPPGSNFRSYLDDAVSRCDVLLAVIGSHWLDARFQDGAKKGQQRLYDDEDFVRWEIASALTRGIPTIPVLLGQTHMPSKEELPPPLQKLADQQAIQISAGADFSSHVSRLVQAIEGLGTKVWKPSSSRKIFFCHTSRDLAVATIVEKSIRVAGDTFLNSFAESPDGVYSSDAARWLIDEADLFLLLWSSNLATSPYCEREWRYAISLQRENFIWPFFYEQPLDPIPPKELIHLHFQYLRESEQD